MKDTEVSPNSKPIYRAIYSEKEKLEAGPGLVGKPMGMCNTAEAVAPN